MFRLQYSSTMMKYFSRLVSFESEDGQKRFFADLGSVSDVPAQGASISAYESFQDLLEGKNEVTAVIGKLLAPIPRHDLPIYCVGLNYRSHAKEANLNIPTNPPLWTKPAAALASPDEDINMSRYCTSNFPDWEGELVFVTSKECRDVSADEAESCILGYTIGNDLSCRVFQLPAQNGGQFFYAKAFDKFAPIGPVLVSPEVLTQGREWRLVTKINGEVMQDADIKKDMVFSAAQILSFMSQSTTIPAYTAVMTGTPSGVGAFRAPKRFLNHGEVVEIEISNIGILKNKILFPAGKQPVL
ncbi:hypothetical protein, variant [Exophiala xenobiotica]|uniref:Fumarylacetoacetase-like C-terminal domain-containing protein n=1 Tax=Exophiala xenobiotica TaxID=348802 RepID=A0A0D2E0U0_9EURO|nr:hypothetical protein, variant [Exophiala xenobiotica]KIW48998.1 hypothetical protein, variant [Exophiala xenobiotica]